MARPRGKSEKPERSDEEFFELSKTPESWEELPKTRAEAKEQSKKYYFTREPCSKKGHYSPRLVSNFGCCACTYIRSNSPESKKRQSEYARENRGKILARVRDRRADPNDSFSEEEAARSKKHREKDIELTRARARTHQRRYYAEDPEAARAYRRQSQAANKAQRNDSEKGEGRIHDSLVTKMNHE